MSKLLSKKIPASLLILSLFFGLAPAYLPNKALAVGTGAASTAAGGTILTSATAVSTAAVPCPFSSPGVGLFCVADYGVRYNTWQILASSVGATPGTTQKETVWDDIAYFAARILIRQLSQSIVDWINSGFEGNPSFIQDPEQFMAKTADRTIGEFIYSSDLNFLCKPFQTNIRLNLGLQYSPFKDKINCTLSDVLRNVDGAVTQTYEDFMNGDFINGGGWDSWLEVTTVPQNNQLGAMIIAQGELDARIANKQLAKDNELKWSGGLLSMKKCTRTNYNADGEEINSSDYDGDPYYYNPLATGSNVGDSYTSYDAVAGADSENPSATYSTKDTCNIVTPGTWITGTGNKVLGMDLDQLGAADEINEIVGALANFVVTKVMEKGMAMVKGDDLSSDNEDWRAGIEALQAQQDEDIANAIRAASSSQGYTPDYSSYSGTASSENNYGTGGNSSGSLGSSQSSLQAYIASLKIPEQAYYDAYGYIYTAANTMLPKFQSIVACYDGKIASSSLDLTAGQINTASAASAAASTTAKGISAILASTTAVMASSSVNLVSLQTIYDAIGTVTTSDALSVQASALSNIIGSLHASEEAAAAQSYASTTVSTLISQGKTADETQDECDAFPE